MDDVIAGSDVLIVAHVQPAAIQARLAQLGNRLMIDLARQMPMASDAPQVEMLAEMSV